MVDIEDEDVDELDKLMRASSSISRKSDQPADTISCDGARINVLSRAGSRAMSSCNSSTLLSTPKAAAQRLGAKSLTPVDSYQKTLNLLTKSSSEISMTVSERGPSSTNNYSPESIQDSKKLRLARRAITMKRSDDTATNAIIRRQMGYDLDDIATPRITPPHLLTLPFESVKPHYQYEVEISRDFTRS